MGNSLNKSKQEAKASSASVKKPCTSCKCQKETESPCHKQPPSPTLVISDAEESPKATTTIAASKVSEKQDTAIEEATAKLESVNLAKDLDVQQTKPELTEYSLANKKLKLTCAEDVKEHVEIIKANPRLRVIALNGNTFGVDAAKALSEAFSGLECIEEMYLYDCFTGRMKEEVHVAVEAFNHVLKTKSTLKLIDYSDNAFGPIGAKAMAVLLSEATTLRELVLNNNGLGPEGGKIIAQALIDCQKRNIDSNKKSSLRRVEIGRNRLENGSSSLMSEAFKAHGLLEEIALPQNGIRPEGIVELSKGISSNPDLVKVNLQDNTFTSTGAKAFAKAIEGLKNLKVLNIGDCLLGNDGCEMIISSLKSSECPIESFNLQYNEMNEKGLEHLISILPHLATVKVLMLNGNCFNPEGETADSLRELLQRDERIEILDTWSDMEYYSDEEEEEDEESNDEQTRNLESEEDLAEEISRMNI